jgi:hypothetical protein
MGLATTRTLRTITLGQSRHRRPKRAQTPAGTAIHHYRIFRPPCGCLSKNRFHETFLLTYNEQQQHAIRSINQPVSDLPPQADWEGILAPLRTDFQRQLASPFSFQAEGFPCWGTIWLRTCYGEGTDEVHQRLLDELNLDLAIEVEQNILNDAELYDYGDDWQQIFEVMPERLFEETLEDVYLRDSPAEREARLLEPQASQRKLDIDDVTDMDALRQATVPFHFLVAYRYLFVADKVALDTGEVLLVFFDDSGRTVRQSRIQPQHCEEIAGAWFDCFIDEMDEFREADIGPEYLPGGSCGPPYATQTAKIP